MAAGQEQTVRVLEVQTAHADCDCRSLLGNQECAEDRRCSPCRLAATIAAVLLALAAGGFAAATLLGRATPPGDEAVAETAKPAHVVRVAPTHTVTRVRNATCVHLLGIQLARGRKATLLNVSRHEKIGTSAQCAARCQNHTRCAQAVFSADGPTCYLYDRAAVEGRATRLQRFNSSICTDKRHEGLLKTVVAHLKSHYIQQPRFLVLDQGACADADAFPITDEASCNRAARQLSLEATTAERLYMWGRPEGCYLHKVQSTDGVLATLYFNLSPKSAGQGSQQSAGRMQICKAGPNRDRCAGVDENCMLSQCCAQSGSQCFERDVTYATCMPRCNEAHRKHGWTCHRLGDRTPMKNPICAKGGEDCTQSMCCQMPGLQCFQKTSGWASCQALCPGLGWTCKTLGRRTPLKNTCSWPEEECSLTKFCCQPGQTCFSKNSHEAYCKSTVDPTWRGTVLGHSRWEYAVQPAPAGKRAGTSLFCFASFSPGSNEWNLLQAAKSRRASIFACDESAVFKARTAAPASQGSEGSVVNTDVLVKLWDAVKEDGRFLFHDWTVKVLADVIFFPDRLRRHLKKLSPPRDYPIYIKNMANGADLFGAIEVFSTPAMIRYHKNSRECARVIGNDGGQDGYMKGCMDMISAGYMTDTDILKTPRQRSCADTGSVCFHSFKGVDAWVRCYTDAKATR